MRRALRGLVWLATVALVLFAAWRMIGPRLYPDSRAPVTPVAGSVGTTLPALTAVPGWLNGGPLTPDSLRGHPTVVALWSDTDPECLKSLPAIDAWHQGYARFGARIIAVHEPDFAFAADSSVPASVVRRLRLRLPVALDAASVLRGTLGGPVDGPRMILTNATGTIVAVATGQASLAGIERGLRAQLHALHPELEFPRDPSADAGGDSGAGAAPPAATMIFLGTGRVQEGPLADATPGKSQLFTAQFRYQVEGKLGVPYPIGLWTPGAEGPAANRGGAENFIALRYDAGALWAVLSPPPGDRVRVWVLSDEKWLTAESLGDDAALDERGASYVDVGEPRAYAVCRARPGEHVVKLSPAEAGVVVHALIIEPPAATAGR